MIAQAARRATGENARSPWSSPESCGTNRFDVPIETERLLPHHLKIPRREASSALCSRDSYRGSSGLRVFVDKSGFGRPLNSRARGSSPHQGARTLPHARPFLSLSSLRLARLALAKNLVVSV